MSAEADGVLEEAGAADGAGAEEGDASRSSEVTNDMLPTGRDMMELSVYRTSEAAAGTPEASVLCIVTDETTARRFNYSMPFSSAVTDLYAAIAAEAGVCFK